MPHRPDSTDARREHVRRAALECLVDGGFASLSVQDIARRAGVSTGILYHYFTNKDDILLQALAMAFREADAALRAEVARAPHMGSGGGAAGGPGGRLPRYLQAAATMGRDHREATRALMAALGHTGASPEVRDRVAHLFADFRRYAHELVLEDLENLHEARAPMSRAQTEAAAALIVAMGIGLACQWAVDPDAVNTDAAGWAFQRLWRTRGPLSDDGESPAAPDRRVSVSRDDAHDREDDREDERGGL